MLVKRGHEVNRMPAAVRAGEVARLGPDHAALREVVREPGPVAWAYVRLDNLGEDERDTRRRALLEHLAAQGAPPAAVEAIRDRLAATGESPRTLALLVTADGRIAHQAFVAHVGPGDLAGWSAPPSLVPLLAAEQERLPYVLAVIDRAGAELWSTTGGDAPVRTETVIGPDDEIERNAPGGWQGLTQGRYQHRAEDSWMHNARSVASAVVARAAEVGAQVLVLSGDVRAVQYLTEALPPLPGVLVRHISGSRAHDGSQAGRPAAVQDAVRDAAREQSRSVLAVLAENLGPGGHAVAGQAETVDALAAGRVAVLAVTDPAPGGRRVWFGAGATEVFGDHESAVLSGRPVEAGDLVDVVVRAALLSGARVRVLREDDLDAAGGLVLPDGLGAVCRFGGP